MRPSFNTTGPCFPDEHYMLPPERRLGRVMELIDDGKYFPLHAGRQDCRIGASMVSLLTRLRLDP